ncbi:hypothetical protein LTR93_002425 [Exophiala xenobiotica]|nr:hypothetical protein LTR93_002425 [Exophiala xenobiotica]
MANEHSADFKAFQKMITRIDRILDKVRPGSSLSSIAKSFYYTITLGGRDLWSMRELSPKDRRMNWFAFGFDHVDDGTQWVQPKACSDVRDRIFAILAFTTHGSSFKVDYRLNPFELLLESLWLEQPGDVWVHEAEKATCMTAYLLNITPLSIMMYSDRRRQMLRDPCSGKYVEIPGDVELLHLRSASSDLDSRRWLKVAAPGREDSSTLWHPWDVSGMRGVWRLDDLIGIPRKAHKRFALSFYHQVDAILVDAILVIAVSFDRSRPTEPASLDRNTILVNDDLTDDEFLDQRPKGCRAVGIYSATCTPKPMRVYYALLEIPVEGPKTRLSVRTATTVGSMRSRGSR